MSSSIRNSFYIVHKTSVKITEWGRLFGLIVRMYTQRNLYLNIFKLNQNLDRQLFRLIRNQIKRKSWQSKITQFKFGWIRQDSETGFSAYILMRIYIYIYIYICMYIFFHSNIYYWRGLQYTSQSILFKNTCLNENTLPWYTNINIYIRTYWYVLTTQRVQCTYVHIDAYIYIIYIYVHIDAYIYI